MFVQNFRYYTGTILAAQPIFGDIAGHGLGVKPRQDESKIVFGGGVGLAQSVKADFASKKDRRM